jgi:hypothetical protein
VPGGPAYRSVWLHLCFGGYPGLRKFNCVRRGSVPRQCSCCLAVEEGGFTGLLTPRICKPSPLKSVLGVTRVQAEARIAGTQPIDISGAEVELMVRGWSVKKAVFRKPVAMDIGDRVGTVPDKPISIVGVCHYNVAIPVEQIGFVAAKLILAGGSREAIRVRSHFR